MWYFQRIDPVTLLQGQKYVSFVGAGGKTSLIEYLGAEASKAGRRVVMTTTTRIWATEPFALLGKTALQETMAPGTMRRIGKGVEKGKLTGLDFAEIQALDKDYDLVLVEADGSKGCPLKYPADYEPVIPPFSDRVVVVAGLDGLYGRVAEKVFRWELVPKIAGWTADTKVSVELFGSLFGEDGLMKGVGPGDCTIVLNKYDACTEREKVPQLARLVSKRTGGCPVMIASVHHGIFYQLTELK